MLKVITKPCDLNFDPRSMSPMPIPRNVLMVRPTYFNVDFPINAHMRKADGSKHEIDKNLAFEQWNTLKSTYESLGIRVKTIDGGVDLPDMCFCANQSFPFLDRVGAHKALLSNMENDTRHLEVPLVAQALKSEGYETIALAERGKDTLFEGMGDCLWLPGKRFLLGAYGFRTSAQMYEKIVNFTEAPVALFELKKPKFYHLDTCLCLLNDETALACREAFTSEGWELLQKIFPNLIEVPLAEADAPGFACNAHCPDGKHVIIQKGCLEVEAKLAKAGFKTLAVDTAEFIKGGGSVFCLKLMFF